MRRFIQSLTLTALMVPTMAHAQDVTMLSLDDAVKYALRNNVNVRNARLDVNLQSAKNAETTSAALPRLNAKAELMAYPDDFKQFIPANAFDPTAPNIAIPVAFSPKYNSNASVSLTQVVFDGSVLVALQARNTVMELFRQTADMTEENTRQAIQKAYYAIVIAERQYHNLGKSLAFARSMLREQDIMKQNGFVEKIEVDRSTVQVNNLAADSMKVAATVELAQQMLKYQMGMDVNQPILLTDTLLEDDITDAVQLTSENTSYDDRAEYSMLRTQLKLNEYDLKRYRMAALPSLNVFGTATYLYATNQLSTVFDFSTGYVFNSLVGVQLNVPVFNGLQRVNQVKQAKINLEKTRNSIDQMKLTIDFQTESARTTLKNAIVTMQSNERNMELADNVLTLAQKKYKEGVGSNLEVSVAQTDFLQAQSNYYQSLLDVMNAKADLQKALGLF